MDDFIVTPWALGTRRPAMDRLAAPGTPVVPPMAPGDERARMLAVHDAVRDAVAATVESGHRPVSMAGDCCAAIGVAAGLQRAGLHPVLVWLDAHGDFNTWETTRTRFIGGMPLAMLAGRGDQSLMASAGTRVIAETDITLSDARDLDPAEGELLASSGVRRVRDIARLGAAMAPDRPIWVHFDCDILDPSDAPAMPFPTPGGPPRAAVVEAARAIARTGRVAAVSVDVWDVANDSGGRTEAACRRVVDALLGR